MNLTDIEISILIRKKEALQDEVCKLRAENDDLLYKLQGVMWSVDKWLDGKELEQDEVNRAATMREKTLQITEWQQAEIEMLRPFGCQVEVSKKIEQEIRAEAVKEFAERLKKKTYPFPCAIGVENAVTIRVINDLVKEMTENEGKE